ncbi:MAG: hypothetical protein CMN91_02875 [Synechococcus sp. ARS1019]|nr:hypothetical protein [Synechococcus sp. ARS1019]
MATASDLIGQTPRGSFIQKLETGEFRVCDGDQHCHLTSSLYKAEEIIREMELGYSYPYATHFRHINC